LKQASEPHAFGSFTGALGEGQHLAAFTDPAAAQAATTAQKGGDILTQILGSHNAREEIALQASSTTGISQDTLAKMLPVITSMIFGGLMKSIENQGFDAILGQLARSRLHSRPDIGRRAESDGSGATAIGRSGPGPEEGRGAWRYFGVHPGKSY
jgi:hypothetical protein